MLSNLYYILCPPHQPSMKKTNNDFIFFMKVAFFYTTLSFLAGIIPLIPIIPTTYCSTGLSEHVLSMYNLAWT